MPVTPDKSAPYAPGGTILEVIERRRSRGLPTPITVDVLGRAGIAPTLLPRVIQSLQGLDLIDAEGQPTAAFEAIRLAPEDEYKTRLGEWLKGTYADVFAFVDPAKDDENRIRDAFRSYQPIGQQLRMVSLFQALCGAAGLMPDNAAKAISATIKSGLRSRPSPTSVVKRSASPPISKSPARSHGLPPALSGLLESLPSADQGWTVAERDKFLITFRAVLDFCIPVVQQDTKSEAAE